MTRTYWLSFCDNDRPKGQQFLGVVVVDVTQEEAVEALALRPEMRDRGVGPWIGAAVRACWQAGVNPGGEVASVRMDDIPDFAIYGPRYPRLKLLNRAEIEALEPEGA